MALGSIARELLMVRGARFETLQCVVRGVYDCWAHLAPRFESGALMTVERSPDARLSEPKPVGARYTLVVEDACQSNNEGH